ncbi:MAG: FemAB family PEP-CTERM system-associated protein [Gammaproteobacteria bacterium]|nr:FemAB family PEP-CTERM system-associated protein [Gammaproteobacteria bacterium]
MLVKELDSKNAAAWNKFVFEHPEATFFHRAEWKEVIQRTYGHPMYFLYAEEQGEIKGVLPLGQVKSRVFGNALISLPFYVHGGILSSSTEAFDALTQKSIALAKQLNVDYMEFRTIRQQHSDWAVKSDLYARFRKEIDPDVETNMTNIPRKQRAVVRKGISAGLNSEWDTDIDRFYESYAYSLHGLGTPAFPRKLFHILKEVFKDDCDVLSIFKDGQLVSSVMNFYFRGEVLPYYAGASDLARQYKAHDFMYWELMRRSCERGLKWFDYGRSKVGTGPYSFKKNWGFEPEPLEYEYFLVNAAEVPNVSPTNPKYAVFINTWKKLPFWATKVIGPKINRYLG